MTLTRSVIAAPLPNRAYLRLSDGPMRHGYTSELSFLERIMATDGQDGRERRHSQVAQVRYGSTRK